MKGERYLGDNCGEEPKSKEGDELEGLPLEVLRYLETLPPEKHQAFLEGKTKKGSSVYHDEFYGIGIDDMSYDDSL